MIEKLLNTVSRTLNIEDLIGAQIVDVITDYDYYGQLVFTVQLKSGEKLAMFAVHYCDGTNTIEFYDLDEKHEFKRIP